MCEHVEKQLHSASVVLVGRGYTSPVDRGALPPDRWLTFTLCVKKSIHRSLEISVDIWGDLDDDGGILFGGSRISTRRLIK